MTEYKELIEKAKRATKQELGDQGGKWREVNRMPDRTYWDSVEYMLKNEPKNLVIEQDEVGIVIDRIDRKSGTIAKTGGRKRERIVITEDLHDLRRFS